MPWFSEQHPHSNRLGHGPTRDRFNRRPRDITRANLTSEISLAPKRSPCGKLRARGPFDLPEECCRFHDLRHTFISRLAESQASDSTVMALAGHVSRAMMERYSHIRTEAKRRAVDDLSGTDFEPGVAQNWTQLFVSDKSSEAKT
ncbi:MAG: tyrosine-type recombinase/integrase [Candidatus Acidiferrales bacterium]